jgi:hypothetical protein
VAPRASEATPACLVVNCNPLKSNVVSPDPVAFISYTPAHVHAMPKRPAKMIVVIMTGLRARMCT